MTPEDKEKVIKIVNDLISYRFYSGQRIDPLTVLVVVREEMKRRL